MGTLRPYNYLGAQGLSEDIAAWATSENARAISENATTASEFEHVSMSWLIPHHRNQHHQWWAQQLFGWLTNDMQLVGH